jgi:hypothetical protein
MIGPRVRERHNTKHVTGCHAATVFNAVVATLRVS